MRRTCLECNDVLELLESTPTHFIRKCPTCGWGCKQRKRTDKVSKHVALKALLDSGLADDFMSGFGDLIIKICHLKTSDRDTPDKYAYEVKLTRKWHEMSQKSNLELIFTEKLLRVGDPSLEVEEIAPTTLEQGDRCRGPKLDSTGG